MGSFTIIVCQKAKNNKIDELTKLPCVVSCSNIKTNIIISIGGELVASVLESLTCNPQEQTLLGIHVPGRQKLVYIRDIVAGNPPRFVSL